MSFNNGYSIKSLSNGSLEPVPLPTFSWVEITLGTLVGKGGFSNVTQVKSIDLDEVYDTSEEESERRKAFAALVKSISSSRQGYVLKTVRNDLPEDEYAKGIVDLAIEANFLQILSHPNIIAMRAMANSDPQEARFFVILDRLVLTLDRKFNYWRKEVGENSGVWCGPLVGYCCSKSQNLHRIWVERIMATRDIANAIQYLHRHRIVYRDLKPDNLGFDVDSGDLKLFDFGLAKRLGGATQCDNGLYMLTGNTGSLRYMAPEVAVNHPYDQRVDAYSFGILFWQICSLTTPFSGFTTRAHAERVVRQGHRPKPDSSWPLSWVTLMKDCWSVDIFSRPSFDHVAYVMEEQVNNLLQDEGVVPTRWSEIRAKKRKTSVAQKERLDVDTRIGTSDELTTNRKGAAIV